MNRLFSIILIVIHLGSSLPFVGIYLSFKLNQDYIAKVLCINKNKPEKKCNGHCQLKKEIKKATEEEKNTPQSIRLKETIKYLEKSIPLIESYPEIEINFYGCYFNRFQIDSYSKDVFHPPKQMLES